MIDFIWIIIGIIYFIWQVSKESKGCASAIIGWIGTIIGFAYFASKIEKTNNHILYIPLFVFGIGIAAYPVIAAHIMQKRDKQREEVMHWLDEHPPTNRELAEFRSKYEAYRIGNKVVMHTPEEWESMFEHSPSLLERDLTLSKWKEERASEILAERRRAKWKL